MEPDIREALERVERSLREEIQASAATTQRAIAESEERTRTYVDGRLAESEQRTRESLRGEIHLLGVRIIAIAQGSMPKDGELGERIGRVEHRVLGLESRVSALEQPPPRRRRRR